MLLGSLPKGDEARKTFKDWKKEYTDKLSKEILNIEFLHGDLISDKEGPETVVGHDLWLIKHTDIIIVNATSKVGAGTSQEMVLAKYFKKPVISILSKDSHHRRPNVVFHGTKVEDWIHPFIYISSDFIAETIEEAIKWVKEFQANPRKVKVKDISIFEKDISYFEDKLPNVVKEYLNRGW